MNEESNEQESQDSVVEKISLSIAALRSDAIDYRKNSGIESDWTEDEEFREGIDDANRGEFGSTTNTQKPLFQAGLPNGNATGSTVFLNITAPYVDMGAARIGDMLAPTDDRSFAINPTPIPDLMKIGKGEIPPNIQRQINQSYPQNEEGKAQAQNVTNNLVDEVKQELELAQEAAKIAQTQIDDWHIECNYSAEKRKVLGDVSLVGCGVMKGPFPKNSKAIAFKNGELIVEEKIVPASVRVDYWNIFPAPDCGDSIHDGSYIFERDEISAKQLRELMKRPDYIQSQIQRVLREGPQKAVVMSKSDESKEWYQRGLAESKGKYEIWYFQGQLSKRDMEAMGAEQQYSENMDDGEIIDVFIEMVNNRIIKIERNLFDTGEFTYDMVVWEPRKGCPWGRGIARKIRVIQRIINGAIRMLMDNAGIAGGPMLVVKPGLIQPADGIFQIRRLKVWLCGEDANALDDIRKAITFIEVPMYQQELLSIVEFGIRMAEHVTGMPLLLQGQQTESSPDTLGGQLLAVNNASTTLRMITRHHDDMLEKPHVRRYYRYLLIYGEDEKARGDFQVEARGSTALVERDIQGMALGQFLQLALADPRLGKDPRKIADAYLKAQRINPKEYEYDDDQWQAMNEQWMQMMEMLKQGGQGGQDSRLQVAQIQAEISQAKIAADAQREQFRGQLQLQLKSMDQEMDALVAQIKAENDQLKEAGKAELTAAQIQAKYQEHIEKLQSEMTQTIMKLDVQRELSMMEARDRQALSPPTEPAGRASPGKSYQE